MSRRRRTRPPGRTPPRIQFSAWPMTPAVRWMLIVLFALWVITLIIHASVRFEPQRFDALVVEPLALDPSRVVQGHVWQLVTYIGVHDVRGLGHIFFNLLALFFFAPPLEERLGTRRMLETFLVGGIAGGLLVLLVDRLMAGAFANHTPTVVMGASGSVSAVVAAMCWLWRDRTLNLILFRAKGWHLLVGFVVLDLLRALTGQPIAVLAHLGGTAAGIALAMNLGPYAAWQRFRLWRVRRRIRTVTGGRDDRDLLN